MMTKIKEFKGSLNPIFHYTSEPVSEVGSGDQELQNSKNNYLLLSLIKPRSNQPRKIFNENLLEELAQSIKSKGVIQPIMVRPIEDGFYEIIVGERRWRAATRAGLTEIPVIIKQYDTVDIMAVSLIENIQRENLNPLEEAQAVQALLEECLMTHHQVAESLGKSRTAVSNLLRLLNLEDETKQMIHEGLLQMGHARSLLSLSGEQQVETAQWVVSKELSVRETEKLVNRIKNPIHKEFIALDAYVEQKTKDWQKQLTQQFSSKVDLHFGSDGKGRVVIHFESLDEADWFINNVRIK